MPLNKNIELVLAMIARAERPPFHALTPTEARAAYEASAGVLEIPTAPMHAIEALQVPTRDGASLRARLYWPTEPHWAEPLPALVYFHGGGFTVGSIDTHDALCRMFARDARCAVLSVDYRLAPEHRFPTAVHDAFDTVRWLHEHAGEHAIDATRIALGGDSAGATLATVCAVLARDAGIAPVLQMLIYPGTAGYQRTASHERLADGYLLNAKTIQWFFTHYTRSDADRHDWRFAPLDGTRGGDEGDGSEGGVPDFAGVAPAWIAVAEYDPLVDEGIAYAHKLRDAGNRVTLVNYPGMIHEFFKMGGVLREAVAAHADAAAALRAAFGDA
jgi:acetyl esterase